MRDSGLWLFTHPDTVNPTKTPRLDYIGCKVTCLPPAHLLSISYCEVSAENNTRLGSDTAANVWTFCFAVLYSHYAQSSCHATDA